MSFFDCFRVGLEDMSTPTVLDKPIDDDGEKRNVENGPADMLSLLLISKELYASGGLDPPYI